ncbi:MAG: BON domain-containing protein, partial [Gemmatimonadota bacterium]
RGRENDWRARERRGSGSRQSGFGEDWQGGRYGRGGRMREEMQPGRGALGGRDWEEDRPSRYGEERRHREYGDYDYAGSSDDDRYGRRGGMSGGSAGSGSRFTRHDESEREFGRSGGGGEEFRGPAHGYGQGGYSAGEYGPPTGYGYGTAGSYIGGRSDWGGSGTSQRQNHMGRGPRNYKRSEDRIREEINERLTRHPEIDASDVDVRIEDNTVVLSGVVEDRKAKRLAEDIAEDVWGVEDVRNELKVRRGFLAALTGEQADDREVQRTTAREGVSGSESKTRVGRSGSSAGSASADTVV